MSETHSPHDVPEPGAPRDPFNDAYSFPVTDFVALMNILLERAGQVTGKRRAWSQTDLATAMGSPGKQPQISDYIRGVKTPQDQTLRDMVEAFNQIGIPITFEELKSARDLTASMEDPTVPRDDRLRRIELEALTFPPEVRDAWYDECYRAWEDLTRAYNAGRRYERRRQQR